MAYEWRQATPTRNTKYWCGNGVIPILETELMDDVTPHISEHAEKKKKILIVSAIDKY